MLQLRDFQRKDGEDSNEMCLTGIVCGSRFGSKSFSPHVRLFHVGQPWQGFISLYAFCGPFGFLFSYFDYEYIYWFLKLKKIILGGALDLSCGTWDLHCHARAPSMWDLSSPTRDQTQVPYIASWIPNHWTTREVPIYWFLKSPPL